MQPTTVQAICCCGAAAGREWRLCLLAALAGIEANASATTVAIDMIVFIATLAALPNDNADAARSVRAPASKDRRTPQICGHSELMHRSK